MAEDAKPDGPRVLRPTVIGAPSGARPAKPKVAPAQGSALKPTAIPDQPAERPKAKPRLDPPAKRTVTGPTAVAGTERKRLDVTPADILALAPAAGSALVADVLRLLQAVVIEDAGERQAILWGHQLQTDYSQAVTRMLDLTQSDVLARSSSHLSRLIEILSTIDLAAIAGIAPRGVIGGLMSRLNTRIDSPGEFGAARVEIEQLVSFLSEATEPLLRVQRELAEQARAMTDFAGSIEASAIAADYLAARLREHKPVLATRYFDRSLSLSQTLAQIRSDEPLRALQTERPHELIASIQNVVLLVVPRWLGSVSALVAAGARTPTATEAGQLDYELKKIVQQLKP